MTKPRKKYRPKPVASWLPAEDRRAIEIIGHYFAPKLAAGLFDDIDANTLAYTLNLVRKMAVDADYQGMITVCDITMTAFLGIRQRFERIGKWGATGPELLLLEEHLPHIAAWFILQPVHRIEEARRYVLKINARMMQEGLLFADITHNGQIENAVKSA